MTRFSTPIFKRIFPFVWLLSICFACQTINKKVKYYSTEITLKDGKILKGSSAPIANESFSFKDAQTTQKSTIKNADVLTITKQLPEGMREYAQFEIESGKKREKKETVLASYLVKGETSLIAYEKTEHVKETKNINNRMTFVTETKLVKHLYLKRGAAPAVEVITGTRKAQEEDFMDTALEFFADAPELMKKIGSTGYEAKDIKKIVEEYNAVKGRK